VVCPCFLYPQWPNALGHPQHLGSTVLLSAGDVVFHPRKLERSGIFEIVEGWGADLHPQGAGARLRRAMASHRALLMLYNKIRILTAMKPAWGARLTTVSTRQGHYASASDVASYSPTDVTIDRIGDVVGLDLTCPRALTGAAETRRNA
jgi:hypothetical protein